MPGQARLKPITLPDYGIPRFMPQIAPSVYQARYARLQDRMAAAALDLLVVYGDREHAANIAYLTGFDPRFEEALLIAPRTGAPIILTGPENLGLAGICPLGAEASLWPGFGLMGQDRSRARPLADLLAEAGLSAGQTIGLVGWKYFLANELTEGSAAIDLPAYLVSAIAGFGPVCNATALMMDPATGLRAEIEVDELARFEFLASHGSDSIRRVITGLAPGMTEFEAASLMAPLGYPLCCHPMLSTGRRAYFGLPSPSDRIMERGDPITMCLGYQGSLTARAGYLAEGPDDLPEAARDYVEAFVAPYFEAAAEWYETIGLGVTGGEIDRKMRARLDTPFHRLALNPGHLLHIDEWMHSPVQPGSEVAFRSGQAVQIDMIPAPGNAYFTTNIEDGIALLDATGRARLAEAWPETWGRIQARRAFMADVLGIRLKPEVLPLSNLAGWLTPYMLNPGLAMTRL